MKNFIPLVLVLAFLAGSAWAANTTRDTRDGSGLLFLNAIDTLLSGERLPNQRSNSYLAIRNEANVSIVSTVSTVIIGSGVAGDVHLLGLMLTAALTGTCVLTGFADTDGTAQAYTFPAATPAGYKEFLAAKNTAGPLTMTCSDAGDDNLVMIFWRPAK